MSSYQELIKNFENVRAFMRDFYVYGFRGRGDYRSKSARSYDNERRRLESWLGDYMSFVRTPDGKNVLISIDSRTIRHNPLYNALKTKSFTDGDITLHFILFDILYTPSVRRTIGELLAEIDEKYLSGFEHPMMFDESTVRKKLKEYCDAGILTAEKEGRKMYYQRAQSPNLTGLCEVLHFFSEVAPCGVIGSFLLDKEHSDTDAFTFKHHYITGAIDSDVLERLFSAMREKRGITASNLNRHRNVPKRLRMVPLRIFISAQSGRQHLIAYLPDEGTIRACRVDYLSDIRAEEPEPRFDELREELDHMQEKMWGVSLNGNNRGAEHTEHVEFIIRVKESEDYIVQRLEREKRVGTVEKLDDHTYRFSADVYDSSEMIPWIRTFICRIVQMNFSNRSVENRFKNDLEEMYRIYRIRPEVGDDIQ